MDGETIVKAMTARVSSVAELPDINTAVVVLAEAAESEERIEVQRALEFDEQDVQSGMDSHCVVDSYGRSQYAALNKCTLGRSRVSLHLTDEASDVFGYQRLDIDLALADGPILQVYDGLESILSGLAASPEVVRVD